ncbi:MAG: glycine betaine ABC transporter substrate-binding protein [Archaeoglobaceae archaeon]
MSMEKYNLKKLIPILALVLVAVLTAGCAEEIPEVTPTPSDGEETPTATPTPEPTGKTVAEKFDGEIIGIESGAGIMSSTEEAMSEYDLEDDYELIEGSTAAMQAALDRAIQREEWIVVTLWEPHGAYTNWDLCNLEDPQEIYQTGEGDHVSTVSRNDFKDDYPAVYEFLQQWEITADTESQFIYDYSIEGMEAEEIAENWINENSDKIEEWSSAFEGVTPPDETIIIGVPPWDESPPKASVIKQILEEEGYDVETQEMDIGIIYNQMAEGEMDFLLDAWLPVTHEEYWDRFSDDLEEVNVNMPDTYLGLVVPQYVCDAGITSIEDLDPDTNTDRYE